MAEMASNIVARVVCGPPAVVMAFVQLTDDNRAKVKIQTSALRVRAPRPRKSSRRSCRSCWLPLFT